MSSAMSGKVGEVRSLPINSSIREDEIKSREAFMGGCSASPEVKSLKYTAYRHDQNFMNIKSRIRVDEGNSLPPTSSLRDSFMSSAIITLQEFYARQFYVEVFRMFVFSDSSLASMTPLPAARL